MNRTARIHTLSSAPCMHMYYTVDMVVNHCCTEHCIHPGTQRHALKGESLWTVSICTHILPLILRPRPPRQWSHRLHVHRRLSIHFIQYIHPGTQRHSLRGLPMLTVRIRTQTHRLLRAVSCTLRDPASHASLTAWTFYHTCQGYYYYCIHIYSLCACDLRRNEHATLTSTATGTSTS